MHPYQCALLNPNGYLDLTRWFGDASGAEEYFEYCALAETLELKEVLGRSRDTISRAPDIWSKT